MKVKILVGTHAYACITEPGKSMDVLLSAGMSAQKSLRRSAQELREKAEADLARAYLIEEAANILDAERKSA